MTLPTNHVWLELTRNVLGEFRQHRHDPEGNLELLPEQNRLRARLARPGDDDECITSDLTDDEPARDDLATIARDFYQRYRTAIRS